MEISDLDIRAMVRDSIARHGRHDVPEPAVRIEIVTAHASHGMLSHVTGGDPDGNCLIEPAVRCNHCGFCQSMGH